MSVRELLSYLNITAMVLGYILLVLFVSAAVWMGRNWADNWRYKRRRKRMHDIQWDNVRSAWLLDMHTRPADVHDITDRIDTLEHPQTIVGSIDRINTDVMDYTINQIVDYQKEHHKS